MTKLKKALLEIEEKGENISINPSYALKQLIIKKRDEIENSVGKSISQESFQRFALSVYESNDKFKECDNNTFLASLVKSINLGLEPNTSLGHSYLIPKKVDGVDVVSFVIGYRGLIELVHKGTNVQGVYTNTVYEKDYFDIDYGIDRKLTHKPMLKGNRGEVLGYYALINFSPQGSNFVFMTKEEVEAHRDKYAITLDNMWATDFEAMAKKTVIKRLLKYTPLNIDIQRAVFDDEHVKSNIDEDFNIFNKAN